MAKTVKISTTFEVFSEQGGIEAKRVVKEETTVGEGTQHFPIKVAGGEVDYEISLGSINLTKKLFLSTDWEVTLKIDEQSDIGFKFAGSGYLSSSSGITKLFVSTGPNLTSIDIIAVGD